MAAGTRGRPYRKVSANAQRWATKLHAAAYRATGGRIGGRMLGSPVLLLLSTGRKTGLERTTPLLYLPDGDRRVIVASNGGTAGHPVWWLNLQANPGAKVEIGGRKIPIRAREARGEERDRLWRRLVEMYPPYEDYQKKTDRGIPVVVLEEPNEGSRDL